MTARIVPLGSGSQGNATLVQLGETRLLVDAGLSARRLDRRLAAVGVAASEVDFVLLSHEHQDHSRGAERFSKRHGVPVVCSRSTLDALDLSATCHLGGWHELEPGRRMPLNGVVIDAFPVPHDAVEPVGFVVEGAGVRLGLVTDLGHVTTLVVERLRHCDALMVEANHDHEMLRDGPYPWQLKQRVAGRMGHLSNHAAAALLRRAVGSRCQVVVLAHLSRHNNTPERARRAAERALAEIGRGEVELVVAAGDRPTEVAVRPSGVSLQRDLFA